MKRWTQENPWATLPKKHGFFVPALDVEHVRQLVARAAVPYRFKIEITPGVYRGLIGVWCYRKDLGPLARLESSFADIRQDAPSSPPQTE